MSAFVDTSGFYALLDRDDRNHELAAQAWTHLLRGNTPLVTSSYVVVETTALVQHRLGMSATRTFHADMLPIIELVFVAAEAHRTAVAALLAADRRGLSLVDCTSFEIMRMRGLLDVLCFDPHFAEQGFRPLGPGPRV